jgi:leucyl aminopeptidase (aminopeptidase T)
MMALDLRLPMFNNMNVQVFENVIKNSLQLNKVPISKVLVIGDRGQGSLTSPLISSAYFKASKNLGLNTDIHIQNHKFVNDQIDVVLARKLKQLPEHSVVIINVSNKMGKFDFKSRSFRNYAKKHNHRYLSSSGLMNIDNRHIHYFVKSLDVDFKKQHKFGERLAKALDKGSQVNIQTKKGTDLTLNIKNRKSINNSGMYDRIGYGGNMPAGEVYIPPIEGTATGKLVLDGSIRTWKKTILPTEPITLEIDKGRIKRIKKSAMSQLLKDTFAWGERRSKFPERVKQVCELGIGTNKNAKLIGTTIVDEKKFGTAHIAFGSNSWMGGTIKAKTHFDQVFKDPIIRIDGRLFRF